LLAEVFCELGRCSIANGTVRSDLVVIPPPESDERFGTLDGRESVFVEAFVAEFAVELSMQAFGWA